MSVSADALEQYMILVYAGLTGSVTMITCTVLALTRLVFEYKGRLETFNNFPRLFFERSHPQISGLSPVSILSQTPSR